ncbi:hypothetical protein [Ornithinibacillus bavariensis]|uniref:Uncharacterized protein n=1 Tax=Ornithinibacillus bavariensis TaxID=545502 RepID=A0A919X8P0_9BACI|nr:hypothetical protein [Ornithinibacillus bavariensis]GIO28052.1 hypothetical protein J43TS3_26630 [Ornithinibacillus bavariensis]
MSLIHRIDSFSKAEGLYSFITESNSIYQVRISKDKRTLIRFPQADSGEKKFRKDNEELMIIGEFSIVVGKPAIFTLEPLGEFGNCTIRITNIVKSISYIH